jgi:hypothetical protein
LIQARLELLLLELLLLELLLLELLLLELLLLELLLKLLVGAKCTDSSGTHGSDRTCVDLR